MLMSAVPGELSGRQTDEQVFSFIYILTSVPALCAGPSQQINLFSSNHEYTEHMHVTSTVGELLS